MPTDLHVFPGERERLNGVENQLYNLPEPMDPEPDRNIRIDHITLQVIFSAPKCTVWEHYNVPGNITMFPEHYNVPRQHCCFTSDLGSDHHSHDPRSLSDDQRGPGFKAQYQSVVHGNVTTQHRGSDDRLLTLLILLNDVENLCFLFFKHNCFSYRVRCGTSLCITILS